MSQSALVIDRLKRELKARGITYAHVAQAIGLSEATIKRLFARNDLTLSRLERICTIAQIGFTDLTRGLDPEYRLLTVLSEEQENAIVADPVLFIAATSALDLTDFRQILEFYDVPEPALVQAFTRLDRIGFLRLLPNNRYRLLVARSFRWLPNGPIQRSFKEHAAEYFDSAFDGPDEFMVLLNTRLSKAHGATLIDRLRRLTKDVSEQHGDDARLPPGQRRPLSLLLAVRPWRPAFLKELERKRPTVARRVVQRR